MSYYGQTRYYYVTFISPAGIGASFHKSVGDLFRKTSYDAFTAGVARQFTLQTQQMFPREAINILTAVELNQEAAMERWPEDFTDIGTPVAGVFPESGTALGSDNLLVNSDGK